MPRKIPLPRRRGKRLTSCLMLAFAALAQSSYAQSPGGVSTGLKMWLKADAGVTATAGKISQWNDQSGRNKHVIQNTAAAKPTYLNTTGLINYNPAVSFGGAQVLATLSANAAISGTDNNFNVFSALSEGVASQDAGFFSQNGSNWFDFITRWSNGAAYISIPTDSRYRTAGNSVVITPGVADVWQFTNETGATGAVIKKSNRNLPLTTSTAGTSYTASANYPTYVGSRYGTFWRGTIGEVMLYSTTALTAQQKQKINSYLSVKWGVTMDQTVPTDYLASDNSVIWHASANTGYYNHITGIGRDDASGLNQKQSRNQDSTGGPYAAIGLGTLVATNAGNGNTFATDRSFAVWSDDGQTGTSATTVAGDGTITLDPGICGAFTRMARTFKIEETGSVGAVQVRFGNLAGISIGLKASDFYLAINNSATFAGTVTKLVPATSFENGILIFDNVDFTANSSQFFTVIGKKASAPAGIASGLRLWLKADAGINLTGAGVSQWDDQSGMGKNVLQTTSAAQPTVAGMLNYNPIVNFNGAQYLQTTAANPVMTGANSNMNVFTVAADNIAAQNSSFLSQAPSANGSRFDYITRWGADNRAYLEVPNSSQFFATPTGMQTGFADVWQFTNELGATGAAIKRSNLSLALNSTTGTSYTATAGNPTLIGTYYNATSWNGKIGELLIYSNAAMTATSKQKINTYLAVKWGVTLDQTVATDYLASDSTVIWNAAANNTYRNRITGIGRDDCSGLNQKQSRNQDTTGFTYVAMGLGSIATSNSSNSNSFGADKNFNVWGDDGVAGVTSAAVTGDGTITLSSPCGAFTRLAKTFKVQETGNVGALQVVVKNFTGISIGASAADFYLAINNTATFTGVITKLVPATSYSNGILTFDNVDFAANSSQFFTVIGKKVNAPAGVTTGIRMWLKADVGTNMDGTAVVGWDDQSGLGKNVFQANAARQPAYVEGDKLMNFNPSINFNAAQSLITAANNAAVTGVNSNINLFAVSAENALSTANNTIFGQNSGQYFDFYTINNASNSFMEHNGANQFFGPVPLGSYAVGVPDVWQFTNELGANGAAIKKSNRNIVLNSTTGVSVTLNTTNGTEVGSYAGRSGSYFNGKIGEILLYSNNALTATQKQKINSYLAIKWGVTLDQTIATNYLASDSTVVWNATTAGAWKKNITGIGRDMCSDLYQKQSKSVNPGAQITLGLGAITATNTGNLSTLTDKSFLVWADDSGALVSNPAPVPAGTTVVSWLTRKWQAQETNTVGSTQMIVPNDLVNGLSRGGGQTYLLVADDAAFTTNVTEVPMTNNGNNEWVGNYDFNGLKYFTFGKKPVPEICGNNIDDDLNGLVDSYDDACPCDMAAFNAQCSSTCNYTFTPEPFKMKTEMTTAPQSAISYATNLIGDIDNDGEVEIITIGLGGAAPYASSNIQIFNGKTGALERTISTPELSWNDFIPYAIGNVDNTPEAEIVAMGSNGYLYCYNYSGTLLWTSNVQVGYSAEPFGARPRHGSAVNLADFNNDGIPEVYVYDQIFNARTGVKLVEGGGVNGLAVGNTNSGGVGSHPVAADLLPEVGGLELACGRTVYQVTITNTNGMAGNSMTAINAPAVAYGGDAPGLKDGYTSIADVDDDGLLDVIVTTRANSTSGNPMVYIWNPRTQTIMSRAMPAVPSGAGTAIGVAFAGRFSSTSCTIGIGFCTSLQIQVYDYAPGLMTPKWVKSTTDGSGATGMTLFDFNQDGKDELVYRDQTLLRIIDAENGDVLTSQPCASGTYVEMPTVADIAGDGTARICITCATNGQVMGDGNYNNGWLGVLKVFASGGQPWAPARKVWNQQAYHVTNVNDDLSIPVREQSTTDTLVGPNCATPCRNTPYNSFLRQATFRTRSGCVQFAAADATVTDPVLTYGCPRSEVAYTVTNLADVKALPAGVSVAFYNGDPMQPGAVLIGLDTIETELAAGASIRMEKALVLNPSLSTFQLYVVVNDDTSKKPALTFPITNIPECNYLNNIAAPLTVITPTAGPDDQICISGTADLLATNTPSGNWIAAPANPGTAVITTPDVPGTTVTNFSTTGNYNFVWNFNGCVDTATVVVTPANDAGPDQSLGNYNTSTATMAATGTGTWSLGAGSAGTATITSPASAATTVTNFSTSGTYYMIWTNTDGCSDTALITTQQPLPVTLLSFSAIKTGEHKALISWSTAIEKSVDHFTVERSSDAAVWNKIGIVKAAGNSNQERKYQLNDPQPVDGINYYRLRIMDVNSDYTLSDIRQLTFNRTDRTLTIAPNPTSGHTVLSLAEPLSGDAVLKVWNSIGQMIISHKLRSGMTTYDLDLSNQPRGIYQVVIEGDQIKQPLKLIVQ